MKKLLGFLGTITIAGRGMVGLVGNAPAKIKENNNLQNLIRVKRGNENILRVKAKSLGHDWLYAKISHDTWTNIAYQHDVKNLQEFKNSLFLTLNNFPKINESWQVGVDWDEMGAGDIAIIRNVITDHFDRINTVFKNKSNNNLGLIIRTNRDSYWTDNDAWWGVDINYLNDGDGTSSNRGEW